MSERVTTERAAELLDAIDFAEYDRANDEPGAEFAANYNRRALEKLAPDLAADLLDARAALAAERTRREAAEARLAAIVASTARDLDALRAVRHLDEEHGREIAEAIDRAEDGGSHALHLVAALGRAAELRGMLRAVAAAVGCESWHDAATVAADTRARLAAIVGAVRTYLDADREWQRSRVRFIESIDAAAVERTEQLRVAREDARTALDAALAATEAPHA